MRLLRQSYDMTCETQRRIVSGIEIRVRSEGKFFRAPVYCKTRWKIVPDMMIYDCGPMGNSSRWIHGRRESPLGPSQPILCSGCVSIGQTCIILFDILHYIFIDLGVCCWIIHSFDLITLVVLIFLLDFIWTICLYIDSVILLKLLDLIWNT